MADKIILASKRGCRIGYVILCVNESNDWYLLSEKLKRSDIFGWCCKSCKMRTGNLTKWLEKYISHPYIESEKQVPSHLMSWKMLKRYSFSVINCY